MPARFYLPSDLWGRDVLDGDEARHAIKVLRVRLGEEIELFDGAGQVASATVTQIAGKVLEFERLEECHLAPTTPEITLYQAIPKGKNMELIIQKAVELGVRAIQPLITDNTVAVSDAPAKKTEKWQRVALEAAKQCKQAYLPKVHQPCHISEVTTFAGEVKLIASLRENATAMKEVLLGTAKPGSISLLVGPEGDFTSHELDAAEESGFVPVSMGDLVLRVETATLYGLSALRFFYA